MSSERIQQSELWDISRRLVGFDTVSAGSNVQAAEYLANLLEESNFNVRIWREMIQGVAKATVLAWAGPAIPGGLMLSGHIDVVPFAGQPGWTTDPLVLSTDGQRIFGRGVSDMKVFLAQAILAGRQQPLAKLQRPLVYVFTCDEEVAGQGSGRLIKVLPQLLSEVPLPSVALIGEPTNFDIFSANKGYALFDIDVLGKGGHSSAPQHGLNAIEKMAEVIQLIQATNARLQRQILPENVQLFPASPASVLNCGVIHGGLAANMIADACHLTVSIRIAPGDQVEEIVQDLRDRIAKDIVGSMQSQFPQSGITLSNVLAVPALRSPLTEDFCALLCRVLEKSADKGAPYATDGGYFQQLGIKSYICGPGLFEEAHQPNESLPVSNFFAGVEKLSQIIAAWCL